MTANLGSDHIMQLLEEKPDARTQTCMNCCIPFCETIFSLTDGTFSDGDLPPAGTGSDAHIVEMKLAQVVRRLHQHYGLERKSTTACMTSLPPPACCRIRGSQYRQPPEPANPAGLKPALLAQQAVHHKPARLRLGWDGRTGLYWNLMRNNGGSYERTFFDHAHHKLKIRGLKSPVDV